MRELVLVLLAQRAVQRFTLRGVEPGGLGGPVGQIEVRDDPHHRRRETFDDEQPLPRLHAERIARVEQQPETGLPSNSARGKPK